MATDSTNANATPARRRVRVIAGQPAYARVDSPYVPSPGFDKMELHSRFVLSGLPDTYDFAGELAADMRVNGMRPSRIGPTYDEFVRFSQYSDYQYNGKVGFGMHERINERRWLIGIELKISGHHAGSFDPALQDVPLPGQVRIAVSLQFNPTRIIAHAIHRGIDIETAGWRELLTSDDETYNALREMSWSSNDNVLPPRAFFQAVAPFHAIRRAARCLAVVEEFVRYLLVSDRRANDTPLVGEPVCPDVFDWEIRYAEVYQEFSQRDASDTVRRMLPAMRQMASNLNEEYWRSDEHSPAVSYTLRLTKTVQLGIYAKTPDRVRMEVRYKKPVPGTGGPNIEERFLALAENACERVNSARQAIVSRLVELDRPLVLAQAVGALCELSNKLARFFAASPERHQRLLEVLLVRGAVEAGPNGIISTEEARRLAEREILQTRRIANRSSLGNRYPLAPRYASLVTLFQDATNESPVGTTDE